MSTSRLALSIVTVIAVLLLLGGPVPTYAHGNYTHFLEVTLAEVAQITVAGVTPSFSPATLISTFAYSCMSGTVDPLSFAFTCDFGNPLAPFPESGNYADHKYVSVADDGPSTPLIPIFWSLPSASTTVFVFPAIDHGPLGVPPAGIPYEALEFTVWGATDAAAPFPVGWQLGRLTRIYAEGFVDSGAPVGVESDDFASEWSFISPMTVVAVLARGSIIFTPSTPEINECGSEHWCSADAEIDAVGIPVDSTPPIITPQVNCDQPGSTPWCKGTLTVSWTVTDLESPITFTDGCDTTVISSNTPSTGTTLTCTATSAGGTAAESVTVFRDGVAPTIACAANLNRLWPPNHKLVAVTASVTVADAGSGVAGFTLISATSNEPDNGLGDGDQPNDIQKFNLNTPDTNGQLRAERSGRGSGRIYTLTYQGIDTAGNTNTCMAGVTVSHDQGSKSTSAFHADQRSETSGGLPEIFLPLVRR